MKPNNYIHANKKRGTRKANGTGKPASKSNSSSNSKINRDGNTQLGTIQYSNLPELNFGSWIKDNKQGVLGGLIAAGGITSQFFAPGNPIGMQAIGTGASMISGEIAGDAEAERQNNLIDKRNKASRLNNIMAARNPGPVPFGNMYNQPLFNYGGNLPVVNNYMGQSHEGPNNGIPVDNNGNPSATTGNKPIALVEDNEVSFEGYVFSDDLEFEE